MEEAKAWLSQRTIAQLRALGAPVPELANYVNNPQYRMAASRFSRFKVTFCVVRSTPEQTPLWGVTVTLAKRRDARKWECVASKLEQAMRTQAAETLGRLGSTELARGVFDAELLRYLEWRPFTAVEKVAFILLERGLQ